MKIFKILFLTVVYYFVFFIQFEIVLASSSLENACNTKLRSYSVWLVPRERDLNYLQNIINNYSNIYNAPAFTPHITIKFDYIDNLNKVESAMDEVSSSFDPIEVEIKNISASPKFFKTLFLTFKANKKLSVLYNTLTVKLNNNINYEFNPHLSLLYKRMPLDEKLRLTKEINLDLKKITFDKIYLVHAPDKKDIENWKPVYVKELSKS